MAGREPEPRSGRRPLLVGLGASAGGLAAFRAVLGAMPGDAGLAVVVIQHLDPSQESLLAELLAADSPLPVAEATDRSPLMPGRVYVGPPDRDVEVADGALRVRPRGPRRSGMPATIDRLFRSIAREEQFVPVGVVLTGAGGDGVAGLRAIRAAGGLAIAQEPETAAQPAMPRAAIDAGLADLVLPPERIAEALLAFDARRLDDPTGAAADGDFQAIAALLREREDFDLGPYKIATARRRILRRMGLAGLDALSDYLDRLRDDDEERRQIVRDLLIGVTTFFRDAEAFEALKAEAIDAILAASEPDGAVRAWVAGSATGEEAYSLAILLLEAMAARGGGPPVQVFATDVDEEAIRAARHGLYSDDDLGGVPPPLRERYFDPIEGGGYRVSAALRDAVSFAVHDVCGDPPFHRMHLVSCRNLLIYLRPDVQERVLRLFHFALRAGGVLLLGGSESPPLGGEWFRPISKKWRIYRRLEGRRAAPEPLARGRPPRVEPPWNHVPAGAIEPTAADVARRAILEAVVPPSVVVGGDDRPLYLHGELGPYLVLPRGEPRLDVLQMLRPHLQARVRTGILRCRREGLPVVVDAADADGRGRTRVTVRPAEAARLGDDAVLVSFEPLAPEGEATATAPPPAAVEVDEARASAELQRELLAVREDLRHTVEELETSNEELRASHEEALSMNEELQSANEELEATTEELRSLNEDLVRVNGELNEKVEQLAGARDDLANFFASTNLATVMVDAELTIRRYTPAAAALLRLTPGDVGRPLEDFAADLLNEHLADEVRAVLDQFQPVTRELKLPDGRWVVRRALPYRTAGRRVTGVVVTFIDVSEHRAAVDRLTARERQQAAVARLGQRALAQLDPSALMDELVRAVADVLDVEYCKVLELQPGGEVLLKAGVGWRPGLVGAATVPTDLDSQAGYTLRVEGPVIVEDLARERRFSGPALLRDHGVTSGISCVIAGPEGPYGVLGAHARQRRHFTEDDATFLVTAANVLAEAIRRDRAEQRLHEGEEWFRTLADNIAQLAWMADPSGWIFWYNKRWFDYTGTTSEAMEGWGWQAVHHPAHLDRVIARFRRALEQGTVWEDTFPLRGRDGRYRWFLSRAIPIRDESGRVLRWFGTNTDITELRDAQEALQEADLRKNEFLAMLGHELRNPLAAAAVGVELLRDPDHPGEQRELAAMIDRQLRQLGHLVDDLLDASRVSQGKVRLRVEPVRVDELARRATAAVADLVRSNRHTLTVDVPADLPGLLADPVRLEQVLVNLLSNAAKYTEPGGRIELAARVERDEVVLTVRDDGIGMSPELRARAFDLFAQGDRSPGRTEGGLGIGLTLVKTLTELHGGRVEARSDGPGLGSTFVVRLPLPAPRRDRPATAPARPDPAPAASEPRPRRILMVDDNVDMVGVLARLIGRKGHAVRVVHDGPAALEAAAAEAPEVVLLDIGLPGMDGYEVARRLRGSHRNGPLTLIAVSGYGQESDRRQTREAGFDHHLTKPVDLDALIALIDAARTAS